MRTTALPSPGQISNSARLRTELAKAISYIQVQASIRNSNAITQADSLVTFLNAAITAMAPFSALVAGTAPWLTKAVLNPAGTSLVMTFNGPLAATTPATSAFAVVASTDASVSLTSVTVNGAAKTVTLALAETIASGATVTVAYTKPGSNKLADSQGDEVASFTATAVTTQWA